jgi:hypothetical protein
LWTGLASIGLLSITAFAAWNGMQDFASGAPTAALGRDLLSALASMHESFFVILATLLSLLLLIALRIVTGARERPLKRLLALPICVALALWSASFGYGYWWSLLVRHDSAPLGLTTLQLDAGDAAAVVSARIEAVKASIDLAVVLSESQLTREERGGSICGVTGSSSRVGLYMARRNVRDTVTQLSDNLTKSWFTPVQAEIAMLRQAVATLDAADEGGARKRADMLASQVRGGARSIAQRHNERGHASAGDLRQLAYSVSIPPGQAGFLCHDPALSARLQQAADQADEPARLQLREAVFSAGPAGVANAVYNLWNNVSIYASGLATVASSGTALASTTKAIHHTSGGEPIMRRDLLALLTTLTLNLGLFVLVLGNKTPRSAPRRAPSAPLSTVGVLSQPSALRHIGSAFRSVLERAPGADLEWLRQHFVHHASATYFVIPNLSIVPNSSSEPGKDSDQKSLELRAMALNQLAGVLEDVGLISAIRPTVLKTSASNGAAGPGNHGSPSAPTTGWLRKNKVQGVTKNSVSSFHLELLRKADKALDIAGWSPESKREIEVFQVIHIEGSTPLLCLINQATLDQGIRAAQEANRRPAGHPRQRALRLEYHHAK